MFWSVRTKAGMRASGSGAEKAASRLEPAATHGLEGGTLLPFTEG